MREFSYSYEKGAADATFGARFRACVEHSGKTIKEVADGIGLSEKQVSRIMGGGARMVSSPGTLQRAARLFGVSSVWLYAGSVAPARLRPEWFR